MTLVFVLSMLVGALAAPSTVAANGIVTTLTFEINNSCLYGTGAPNTQLRLELRGADGNYQGHFKVMTDGNGNWGYRCFWGSINAGDRIVASDGSNTRTFVVQPLSFKINRVSDVVSGKSVPGSTVSIFVYECQVDWYSCSSGADKNRPTSGTGNFSYDFSADYDIRGGDNVQVIWMSPQGDTETRSLDAPQMGIWVNNNEIWGTARPNAGVAVWLFDRHGTQRAKVTDRADKWDGEFDTLIEKNGRAVDIHVQDFVVSDIASDASLQVPSFNPVFNTGADTFSAKCFKNRGFSFRAWHPDDSDYVETYGTADGNGNIAFNTMTLDSYDLQSDDFVALECRDLHGDEISNQWVVP